MKVIEVSAVQQPEGQFVRLSIDGEAETMTAAQAIDLATTLLLMARDARDIEEETVRG